MRAPGRVRSGRPRRRGWWATGDIAYADAGGELFPVDRPGEPIPVNDFDVYPREVELALQTHPAVVEATVFGVPQPWTGQTVKAYVVPAPVASVEALPRSLIGKIRKTELTMGASDE